MTKLKAPQTPKERLEHAKRLLKNAKGILRDAGTNEELGIYEDLKYVSVASGTAYLSALEALKSLIMGMNNWDDEVLRKRAKDISTIRKLLKTLSIGKDRDTLLNFLKDIYDILHLGGYYRELRSKRAIDDGFEKVEKLIKIVEKYVKQ